jgi:hypothetical protein
MSSALSMFSASFSCAACSAVGLGGCSSRQAPISRRRINGAVRIGSSLNASSTTDCYPLERFSERSSSGDLAEGHADSLALGSDSLPDASAIDAELAALRPNAGFGRKRIAS